MTIVLPWTVHEGQWGEVAPGHGEQGGGGPVDQVPVEEDGPQPLYPGRPEVVKLSSCHRIAVTASIIPVVAQQEERDEQASDQDRDPQLVCRGLEQDRGQD